MEPKKLIEKLEDTNPALYICIMWAGIIFALLAQVGCMQVMGADKIDAWGLKIEANSGTKLYAGIQQYDSANETQSKSKRNSKEGY